MTDEHRTAELRIIQEHKTLKDGFNLLLKRSEESKAKVVALEGESEEFKGKVVALEGELDKSRNDCEGLKVEVERLQAQIHINDFAIRQVSTSHLRCVLKMTDVFAGGNMLCKSTVSPHTNRVLDARNHQ